MYETDIPFGVPVQDVGAGEVCAGTSGFLRASALGSCVAVVICDEEGGAGGMAHVMLPGSRLSGPRGDGTAPDGYRDHHAMEAIPRLVRAIESAGGNRSGMAAVIAGGADVLKGGEDRIGEQVLRSVLECLARWDVAVRARHIGGTERRSVVFDLDTGRVSLAHGDAGPEFFWQFPGKEIPTNAPGQRP